MEASPNNSLPQERPTRYQRTAFELQQEFANDCGTQGSIFWDLYTSNQGDTLKEKFLLLYQDMNYDEIANRLRDLTLSDEEMIKLEKDLKEIRKHNKRMKELREKLFEITWSQRKYNNGDLLATLVFIINTPNIADETIPIALAKHAVENDCTIHILFRIRKCVKNDYSNDCCMVFVDENGRVYQNWKDFMETNEFPEGIIVAPQNGVYDFNESDEVQLEYFRTPASLMGHKIARVTDTVATIGGLGAAIIPIGSLFIPVAGPLIAGATAIGGLVGMWSAGRSTSHLVDRGRHEQSIHIRDRQARASWLGLAGGIIGLGASGATHGLAKYAGTGRDISTVVEGTVNTMNLASIAVNGIGVGNNVLDLILKHNDDDDITALDLLQLSASLVLFTHSVYNFQYAASIVESTQDGKINSFRNELSRRQRKIYDKMVKETIRVKGPQQGKIDIIRGLRNIPDKQYFSDMHKINQDLNQNKVRPSFSSDGQVLLNNEVKIEAQTLRQTLQNPTSSVVDTHVLENIRGNIPKTYDLANRYEGIRFNPAIGIRISKLAMDIIARYVVLEEQSLKNCLTLLFQELEVNVVNHLTEIAKEFCRNVLPVLQEKLRRIVPFEQVLFDIYNICMKFSERIEVTLDENFLRLFLDDILDELKLFYEANLINTTEQVKCNLCQGFYAISNN